MGFIRKEGEKCKVYELKKNKDYSDGESDEDSNDEEYFDEDQFPNIKYGDIIYKENGYRATSAYVYAYGYLNLSHLFGANGSGAITLQISENIENPITFYTEKAISCGDIAVIELDTELHYPVLKKIAGNRDFSKDIEFELECYSGKPIVMFNSAKLYNGKTHRLQLSETLDECYLKNIDFTYIDPITQNEFDSDYKDYQMNFDNVIKVGNNVEIYIKCNNSKGNGILKISDIIYEEGDPIKIVMSGRSPSYEIKQTIFEFVKTYDSYRKTPTWICNNLPKDIESYSIAISRNNFKTIESESENESENKIMYDNIDEYTGTSSDEENSE